MNKGAKEYLTTELSEVLKALEVTTEEPMVTSEEWLEGVG